VHPNQRERFGVLAGSIGLRVDGAESALDAGDWAEVPGGTPHTWWNASSEDAHVLVQVSPALRTDQRAPVKA
jgi:quercetin dioxygenase-like cupin family protein